MSVDRRSRTISGASAAVTGRQLLQLSAAKGVAAITLDRPVHLLDDGDDGRPDEVKGAIMVSATPEPNATPGWDAPTWKSKAWNSASWDSASWDSASWGSATMAEVAPDSP